MEFVVSVFMPTIDTGCGPAFIRKSNAAVTLDSDALYRQI